MLAFTLTMPNRGSWNGRWSGENNLYAVVKKFPNSKKAWERVQKLSGESFYYRWEDGWGANIAVQEVDALTARKLRKQSRGFCGYEWMIQSILDYGAIYADHEKPTLNPPGNSPVPADPETAVAP